jgi:hypothetical protein
MFISLGSHSGYRSHPYSVFTYADDVMSCFSLAFFLPYILHHKGPSTYLCITPFSLFTLGPKDNSNTRRALATVLLYFARME